MGRFSSKFAAPNNVEISQSPEGKASAADKSSAATAAAASAAPDPKCDKKAENGAEKIKSEKEQTPKSKGNEEKVAAKKPQPKVRIVLESVLSLVLWGWPISNSLLCNLHTRHGL